MSNPSPSSPQILLDGLFKLPSPSSLILDEILDATSPNVVLVDNERAVPNRSQAHASLSMSHLSLSNSRFSPVHHGLPTLAELNTPDDEDAEHRPISHFESHDFTSLHHESSQQYEEPKATFPLAGMISKQPKKKTQTSKLPPRSSKAKYAKASIVPKPSTSNSPSGSGVVANKPHTCPICSLSFATNISLNRHKPIHNKAKKFFCTQCERRFIYADMLKRHQRLAHANPTSSAIRPSPLLVSVPVAGQKSTSTVKRTHKCNHCEKVYATAKNLKNHTRSHSAIKSYSCSTCTMSFSRQYSLTRHKLSHANTKSFECTVCNQMFSRKYNLTAHMQNQHAESSSESSSEPGLQKENQIEIPSNSGVSALPKRSAIRSEVSLSPETKKQKKAEDDTGSRSTSEMGLTSDYDSSSNSSNSSSQYDLPIQAGKPDLVISQPQQLPSQPIIKIAEEVCARPYPCPRCNKRFIRLEHVNTHIRTHTGEKPYVCPECQQSYTTKSNLDRHSLTHKPKQPGTSTPTLICKFCGTHSPHKRGLYRHMLSHSNKQQFTCNICNEKFTQKCNLKRHQQRKHPGTSTQS